MLDQLDIEELKRIARLAGDEILQVYGSDFVVDEKADESPLTEADRRANVVILAELQKLYPEVPFISEETKALSFAERRQWDYLWMIDPLDGTKEFVKRNGEFTVNIALVKAGVPVAGVVYQPTEDKMYFAVQGRGAFVQVADQPARLLSGGESYRDAAVDPVRVVASRSHLSEAVTEFVKDLEQSGRSVEFLSSGSSLKLCMVAEGAADVYPRLAPTMEWDTAAADAVVREAGKEVLQFETGEALLYNKENLLNPWFVVE
ncbi:MAG: 3'(2'),5'-bisphosphate nucleotidase CysQ [Verrucomicrobiales bacterium]|nr:3'(2'),5'-bisphosphate nucleotidase CysQ [Verrucomicrobiales bacterium]